MRQLVFSLFFLLSTVSSIIVNGVALSEEMDVKEATQVKTEMLQDKTDTEINSKETDTQAVDSTTDEYTVKQGDTLSEIAENTLGSQEKWPQIAKLNHLDNPDQLFVGQKLKLPTGSQNQQQTQKMKVNENNTDARMDEEKDKLTDPEIAASDDSGLKNSEASATDEEANSSVTGQIESSQKGSDTLIITDESGDTHQYKVSNPDVLNGVKQGDNVRVEFKDGMVVSVVEKNTNATPDQINN